MCKENINFFNEKTKELLSDPKYNFLCTDKHLGNKIVLLALGGSHAYGTNTETSDVDIRGCAVNSRAELLGLSKFEQYVSKQTDTVIYSFNKLVSLLLNCNPNTIEILGCKPEHYLVLTDIGTKLIKYRKLFLSQRAARSFGGYANQQLRRLEHALARDPMPQSQKERHVLNSVKNSLDAFKLQEKHGEENPIELYLDYSEKQDLDVEVFADISVTHFPIREFNSMLNNIVNTIGIYDKLNSRNSKKDDAHLNKHAMHLIRLYLMALDILEKEEICTYREAERELLLDIRNGKYQKEDGTYCDEFFQMVDEYEKRLDYAKKNTGLPEHPNYEEVEEFVMDINARSLQEYEVNTPPTLAVGDVNRARRK